MAHDARCEGAPRLCSPLAAPRAGEAVFVHSAAQRLSASSPCTRPCTCLVQAQALIPHFTNTAEVLVQLWMAATKTHRRAQATSVCYAAPERQRGAHRATVRCAAPTAPHHPGYSAS